LFNKVAIDKSYQISLAILPLFAGAKLESIFFVDTYGLFEGLRSVENNFTFIDFSNINFYVFD